MNFAGRSRAKALPVEWKRFWPIPSVGELLANRKLIAGMAVFLACLLAIVAGRELARRPVFVLGGILGVAMLLWLAARPKLSLIFVVAYTPFEEFLLKFVPWQAYALARYLPELLLFFTLAVLIVSKAIRRQSLEKTPIDIPLFSFAVISLFSVFYNRIPLFVGVLELRILLRYAVAYYVLTQAGFNKRFLSRIFKLMLAIVAIQIAIGLLHSLSGNAATSFLAPKNVTIGEIFVRRGFSQVVSNRTRIFSTFGRYNLYGNFLAFFLLFVIAAINTREPWILGIHRKSFTALLLTGLVALTLSFSRMSWMGFYAGLIFMLLLVGRRRVIPYLVVPIAATFVLFSLYGPGAREVSETAAASILQRYLGMFSRRYVEASLRSDRLYVLVATTTRILRISPALGLGPGSVASAAARVFGGGEKWDALNLPATKVFPLGDVGWAAILAQYGILGLCVFLWVLWRILTSSLECFRRARDSLEKAVSLGFLGGFVCIMVMNAVSFNFTYRPSSLYFWVFAGVVARLLKMQKKEEKAGLE
ncbi:MAG: O-antigen ligase family protein [bacterium]